MRILNSQIFSFKINIIHFVDFPEANDQFGKPVGWKDDACHTLHVLKGVEKLGADTYAPVIISCWQMNDEDVKALVANKGKVYLHITGTGMPPVRLTVADPFSALIEEPIIEVPKLIVGPDGK